MSSMTSLTHLDLSENLLESLPTDFLANNTQIFNNLDTVTMVDLSGNRLQNFPNQILTRKRTSFQSTDSLPDIQEFTKLKKYMVTLSEGGCLEEREKVAYSVWLGGTLLDLSRNRISGSVSVASLSGWLVDVSGNLVTGLGGLQEQQEQEKGRMVLKDNSIPCDCHSSHLQALLISPRPWLLPRSLKCVTPEGAFLPLGPLSPSSLSCPLPSCPSPCSCSQAADLIVTMNCSHGSLTSLPTHLPPLPAGYSLHLLADGNMVSTSSLPTYQPSAYHSSKSAFIEANANLPF